MPDLKFEHILSRPEHIWLEFWRTFFSQKTLMFGPGDDPIQNNFLYRSDVEESNRDFDIKLEHETRGSNIAQVPALIIQDLNAAQAGVLLDQRQSWGVSPMRYNQYRDLVQMNYAFHAVTRDRAESRLLAGIIWKALNTFKDVLYQGGLHQLMPRSISNTQQLRAAGEEDRVDTVVSCPFWIQDAWAYELRTDFFPEQFCFFVASDEKTEYILSRMNLAFQSKLSYLLSNMNVTDPVSLRYVLSTQELVDPLSAERYILGQADLQDPSAAERYIRGRIRVAS